MKTRSKYFLTLFCLSLVVVLVSTRVEASHITASGAGADPAAFLSRSVLSTTRAVSPGLSTSVGSTSNSSNVFLVGQLGGATNAATTASGYIYAGIGTQMSVLDNSNPEQPTVIGQTGKMPGGVSAIAVAGGFAYVGVSEEVYMDQGSLHVVDVADPTAPLAVAALDITGGINDLVVASDNAYIAATDGLHIVDVSNPLVPVELAYLVTEATGITVADSYAYVAARYDGLRIVDVSDPADPVEVGYYHGAGAVDVSVVGDYAYTASGGLRVLDVSNPIGPFEVGFVDTLGGATGVIVADGLAYVSRTGGYPDYKGGLVTVDITNPAVPSVAGYVETPTGSKDLSVAGDYAYLVNGEAGLRVVDVSNPATPTEVGSLDAPGEEIQDVAVADGYAYVTDRGEGLHIIDISNPATPSPVGFLGALASPDAVDVAGNYAYITTYDTLHVIDVSDPATPFEVGLVATAADTHAVAVAGSYAYVANGSANLRVVDVSNPTAPVVVASTTSLSGANDVVISGNYAYVATGSGMEVVDVSDPSNPAHVSSYSTIWGSGIDVAGNYALLSAGEGHLHVIDVSNPAAPIAVAYVTVGEIDVAVAGDYVYALGYDPYSVDVIDIADPNVPTAVGHYEAPSVFRDVAAADDYIFVTTSDGLLLLRFGAPPHAAFNANPTYGGFPLDVTFSNLSVGNFDTSLWDFGDGTTSAQDSPMHTYQTAGSYTVSLTVSGIDGSDIFTRTNYINVYEPVIANFAGTPLSGTLPLSVTFTNLSTGAFDNCLWDLGDGSTDQSCADPAHLYVVPGTYTVSLTATGPGGTDMMVRPGYITVTDYTIRLPLVRKPYSSAVGNQ